MSDPSRRIIVAIDGPAGSGKSSSAKAVAAELGYRHLDSGAFYRAITLAAMRRGIPVDAWHQLTLAELDSLGVSSAIGPAGVDLFIDREPVGEQIRSPDVTARVSSMAAVPAVREWLLGALRDAGRNGGLVADGRDIGTVVFPAAELKVFLVCDPTERARRRLREQGVQEPEEGEIEAETSRLVYRDRIDENRETAPLVQAPDAVRIDTSTLGFDEQVAEITRLARERIHGN